METAVRLGLNLVVLVLRDNAYGMIRWKQQADGFRDFGMTFGNPDFAAYAKSVPRKGKPSRNRRWTSNGSGGRLSRGRLAPDRRAD
jgi:thiamine pyrophosphate-dependent acetolactate synthase large subunit-like protein